MYCQVPGPEDVDSGAPAPLLLRPHRYRRQGRVYVAVYLLLVLQLCSENLRGMGYLYQMVWCAFKEQSLLFDLFTTFAWIESSHKSDFCVPWIRIQVFLLHHCWVRNRSNPDCQLCYSMCICIKSFGLADNDYNNQNIYTSIHMYMICDAKKVRMSYETSRKPLSCSLMIILFNEHRKSL